MPKLATHEVFAAHSRMMNAISLAHDKGNSVPALVGGPTVRGTYSDIIATLKGAVKHAETLRDGEDI